MTNERAGVFEEADDFDVSGFVPTKPALKNDVPLPPAAEAIRAVSEAADFHSREPGLAKRMPMQYRTGRNVQFNVKLRAETVESFYELAKRYQWTLGETVERALAALKVDLTKRL